MSKKVFKYFANFIRPHENWLNKMASKGWRLVGTSIMFYDFEACEPSRYEYRVEFIAHKSYEDILSYKAFLEEAGYRAYHKNINLNYAPYKAQWRPGIPGKAQIAVSPGAYNKELLIIERKKDGKPFILRTDLEDNKYFFKTIRKMCIGYGLFFAMMAVSIFFLNIVAGAMALLFVFSLFARLITGYSNEIRQIEKEQETKE